MPPTCPTQGAMLANGHHKLRHYGVSLSTLAGSKPICLEDTFPRSAAGPGTLGIWSGPALARPDHLLHPIQSCWNCGRKASETCSGCNAARYCGSFCQHKDWEKHHHVCGQSLQGPSAVVADPVPGPPDATTSLGPCLPTGAASPSEAGSTGPSRPGSPGPLDAAPR